jgi:hypothetical protein
MNHMSSISLSLKMMLAASACAGLTLLACGEDASSGSDDGDKTGSKNDAGSKRDAGRDAGRRDAGIELPDVTPGDECDTTTPAGQYAGKCEDDLCDSPPCYARCLEGVYTDCKSQSEWVSDLLGDGGLGGLLRDGGLGGILGDAGLGGILGDSGLGGILGDAGPIGGMCQAEETCSSSSSPGNAGLIISLVAPMGQGICTVGEAPKECTTNADCTGGTCFDGNTIGSQIPVLGAGAFQLLGWPIKFCLAPCKP